MMLPEPSIQFGREPSLAVGEILLLLPHRGLLWVLVRDILSLFEEPEKRWNIWSTQVTNADDVGPEIPSRVVLGMSTDPKFLLQCPKELAPKGCPQAIKN